MYSDVAHLVPSLILERAPAQWRELLASLPFDEALDSFRTFLVAPTSTAVPGLWAPIRGMSGGLFGPGQGPSPIIFGSNSFGTDGSGQLRDGFGDEHNGGAEGGTPLTLDPRPSANIGDFDAEASPRVCGPEATDWFIHEMKWWATAAVALRHAAFLWIRRRSPDHRTMPHGLIFGGSTGLKGEHLNINIMRWLGRQPEYNDVKFVSEDPDTCPVRCADKPRTLTVCDTCIDRSEVGNVAFGIAMAVMGFNWWATNHAARHGPGNEEPGSFKPEDWAAIAFGYYWGRRKLGKYRQMPSGTIRLQFDTDRARFENWAKRAKFRVGDGMFGTDFDISAQILNKLTNVRRRGSSYIVPLWENLRDRTVECVPCVETLSEVPAQKYHPILRVPEEKFWHRIGKLKSPGPGDLSDWRIINRASRNEIQEFPKVLQRLNEGSVSWMQAVGANLIDRPSLPLVRAGSVPVWPLRLFHLKVDVASQNKKTVTGVRP